MRKADYAAQGEEAYTTAIQVADLARREEVANYDFRYGAGAWAKQQKRDAEMELYWSPEVVAEREKAAAAKLAVERANETPAERERREKREAREAEAERRRNERYSRSYWAREDRKADREEAKRGSTAYRAGRAKGDSIGLDNQVSAGARRKELA
jgi:hypothetical protein